MDKYLLQLLTANWLLEKQSNDALRLLIATSIKSGVSGQWLTSDQPKPYALSPGTVTFSRYELSDDNLPDNSVAVIPVRGTLYSWDTLYIENHLAQALNNPQIVSVLLWVQSPGGMVARIDILSDAIKNAEKPVGAYVTQMCCSAAQWIVSGSRFIMASSPMDLFGSVGVMTSWVDYSGLWEQLGVKIEDIYATKSTLKNHESREKVENDNDQPIIDSLDFINNLFHNTISNNRGIPLDDNNDVFKGDTFYAQQAISVGLATDIGTFDDAVTKVLELGVVQKANNFII